MNKKFSSSVLAVALSMLLTACTCNVNKKDAKSGTIFTQTAKVEESNVVLFDFDSSNITEEGKAITVAWADKIKTMKEANVIVTGHCSEEGSEAYNNGLGERRANAVAEALEAAGANTKAHVVSYGKSADFGEGLVKNRRALIHVGEVSGIPNGQAVTKKSKKIAKKNRMKKAKKSAMSA